MFSDESTNVINLGALGTIVLDLETTLSLLMITTAIILNVSKIYRNIKDARKVSDNKE